MAITVKSKELKQLEKENARLMAALNEAEFECERLTIINADLKRQLTEANRELEKNIEVLQSLKHEIEGIVHSLTNTTNQ